MKIGYIAGKYTGKDVIKNIAIAKSVAIAFWKQSIPVITPHLNTALFEREHGLEDKYDMFLNGCLEIVKRVDFIVLLPNFSESKGAIREMELADKLGKPIFYLEDIQLEDQFASYVASFVYNDMVYVDNDMVYKPILSEANDIVNNQVRKEYPHPTENFKVISDIATTIGNKFLSPIDCVNVLISVKLSREKFSHKRDNLVDLAGYAEIKNMIYEQHD